MGIAKKAGYIEYGEDTVLVAVQSGKVRLVLLASDAGEHTRRKILAVTESREIPCAVLPCDKGDLGAAIGKGNTGCAAITDMGIAVSFAEKLASDGGGEYERIRDALRSKAEKMKRRKKEKDENRLNTNKGKRRV